MAERLTKVKVKKLGDKHQVLVLINHPMETGQRKDKKTGEKIPAHFIETITFELNGNKVAEASLGSGVSKNPLTGVELDGAKPGDTIKVSWTDNKGESGGTEATVK
ncbi:MAG: thiosulfate oxidation carrier complex protein SoxZ [Gammaproteobacteria bacterium]|nr:thiosulfate oxidation carrier complex protein SoxZ [Gammaproteobacteria bacterium]